MAQRLDMIARTGVFSDAWLQTTKGIHCYLRQNVDSIVCKFTPELHR